MIPAILVNYNFTPKWLTEYGFNYRLYDRSDDNSYLLGFPEYRIIRTKNIGNVDYDKLGYLIENYDNLPEVFLWGKTNLFKYISKEEFDLVKDNKTFTPLLTKNHKTYSDATGVVCYYDSLGMYREVNNSWFLNVVPAAHVKTWNEWAEMFGITQPTYIPFAPGGNYILTRDTVHKHTKALYQRMRDMLVYNQLPGEAHCAERSYYLLWK
jgi:hypothetical protein